MKKKQLIEKLVLSTLALMLGLAGMFMVVGCGSGNDDAPAGDSQAAGDEDVAGDLDPIEAESVTGVIISISEGEMVIEVAADAESTLSGEVRVGLEELDPADYADFAVGDTVVVEYAGIVGLSEPPFISATAISPVVVE